VALAVPVLLGLAAELGTTLHNMIDGTLGDRLSWSNRWRMAVVEFVIIFRDTYQNCLMQSKSVTV
jgi:hypothetical protein